MFIGKTIILLKIHQRKYKKVNNEKMQHEILFSCQPPRLWCRFYFSLRLVSSEYCVCDMLNDPQNPQNRVTIVARAQTFRKKLSQLKNKLLVKPSKVVKLDRPSSSTLAHHDRNFGSYFLHFRSHPHEKQTKTRVTTNTQNMNK